MRTFLLFLFLLSSILIHAQTFKVGTKVEIKYGTAWYPGSVIAVNGGQYKVHYEGYGDNWDEWVGTDRLKIKESRLAAADPNVKFRIGSQVDAEVRGKIYGGSVVEIKDNKYKIRFDGYTEYWDEWVDLENLRPKGTGSKVQVSTSAAAKGKLYLRNMYVIATGNTELKWFFLSDDGTIVLNPQNGVNPVNMVLEKQNNMQNMGRYQIKGNTMQVQWMNGQTTNWGIEQNNGILKTVDAGGYMYLPQSLPSDYRLNGSFSGSAMVPGVGVARTYIFKQDGTFTVESSGYTSTAAGGGSSSIENKGTYKIAGNTLQLNYANGKTERSPIAILKDANGTMLIINTMSFSNKK